MESGSKRTQRDYTLAFKLAVVEQVEKGELTYKQAQARYGLQGRSTVLVWLRQARSPRVGSWCIMCSHAPPDKTPQALTPEQQIKALQVQLKEASEKAQLFEAMLDVLRNARMLVPVRRAYHKTTDSHRRFRRHPNRLRGLACA